MLWILRSAWPVVSLSDPGQSVNGSIRGFVRFGVESQTWTNKREGRSNEKRTMKETIVKHISLLPRPMFFPFGQRTFDTIQVYLKLKLLEAQPKPLSSRAFLSARVRMVVFITPEPFSLINVNGLPNVLERLIMLFLCWLDLEGKTLWKTNWVGTRTQFVSVAQT